MIMEVTPYIAQGERYPSLIGVKADGDEHELAYVSKHELIKALEERDRLQAESAKLRRLVRDLDKCASNVPPCDKWCFHYDSVTQDCRLRILDRVRELGIEAGE